MTKMMIIILILLVIASIPILLGLSFSAPAYKGPLSDHFSGKKFINPGNIEAKGIKDLIKWARNRERSEWKMIESVKSASPIARINGDSMNVTFINHSSFLLQSYGLNILTDPIWSERASPVKFAGPRRMVPPGIKMEDLPQIHVSPLTSHAKKTSTHSSTPPGAYPADRKYIQL